MTTLSPAAQAVIDAYVDENCGDDPMPSEIHGIAAALRAVADQVVPAKLYLYAAARAEAEGIREDLLAIAAELEDQP